MLKTRVITALALLAILLAVLFFRSFPFFAAAITVFFAAATWESMRLFGSKYPVPGAILWAIAFIIIISREQFAAVTLISGLCVAIWIIRLLPSLAFGLPARGSVGNLLLNTVYTVSILGCFVAIGTLFRQGSLYLFSIMAIVWVADIGAYFTGKAIGKNKIAPSISPGKTWEGAIGGWLCVLILAAATTALPISTDTFMARLQADWGWTGLFSVMTLLVAASIVGDLFESQLKRRAGMKDSSNLLPGHGGVLDRIDALIPVMPLAVLLGSWR
jgi:phosphatidate cytidylyltransferase